MTCKYDYTARRAGFIKLKLEHVFKVLEDSSEFIFTHNGRVHRNGEGWEADCWVSRNVDLHSILPS